MIELSKSENGQAQIGFGGDTLNTAVYLSRLGIETGYMTALGGDTWSQELRQNWIAEGIDTSLVATHPTRTAGLYAIGKDASGDRSFTYWRDQSAARSFFELDGCDAFLAKAATAKLLYLSGITLAIFSPDERRRICDFAVEVRRNGGLVAFDPNFRPKLWEDADTCRRNILALAPALSIVLPSFDDESALWGDTEPHVTQARWTDLGVSNVVVKNGHEGVLTSDGWVAGPKIEAPVDTTGAGDSFNAGYLALHLKGHNMLAAAQFGCTLAAQVIQNAGAIIAKTAMPPAPASSMVTTT